MKIDKTIREILYVLFEKGVRASRFIDVYRKKNGNIDNTLKYFLKYSELKLEYKKRGLDERSGKCSSRSCREIIDFILKRKIGLLEIGSDDYPELLEKIHLPPPVLFYKGSKIKKMEFAIAVVGSRKYTNYGRDVAGYISKSLSGAGITVVSGLAAGIDSFAHKAAVKEKGGSIGVLGCGIDMVYPPENKFLYESIPGNGAIITEFLPGTPPLKSNFPVRNRIISGLCSGVVVVEAGERSGAIITSEMALEQNREVFAIPGNIFNPANKGCHKLIKQGAKLVEKVDDILEELSGYRDKIINLDKETGSIYNKYKRRDFNLSDNELKIYNLLGYKPKSMEEIVGYSGVDLRIVLNAIASLEMKRLVREDSFNKYVRIF
ncbi:MAG: DNA-processing protein DprA [Actinomycetota bacterium]|nr:DNA-processing protein DprA [Actinomycetota bacterium]